MDGAKIHPRHGVVSSGNFNGSLDERRIRPLTSEHRAALAGLLPLPSCCRNAGRQKCPGSGVTSTRFLNSLAILNADSVCLLGFLQPPPRYPPGAEQLAAGTGAAAAAPRRDMGTQEPSRPTTVSSIPANSQPEPPQPLAAGWEPRVAGLCGPERR